MPITDPWFYAAAVPAMLLVGISKGGFGGGLAIAGVPLMAFVVPPAQAAAIMLPILVLMDWIGVGAYRRSWDGPTLAVMVPGAAVGIALGGAVFGALDEGLVRLVLGAIAVVFSARYFMPGGRAEAAARPPSAWRGGLFGGLSGFTSTIAHAGGPPASMYLLPLRLDRTVFVGTTVIFFTAVNLMKLLPYALIGQFSATNLLTALALAPLAPVGVLAGVWLHRRIDETLFYRLCYGFVLLTGLKLIHDGLS
ncbi:MAG TPA: sulfite exporter TauE/SafE family protein [Geminicoccaceae bacterium]|nr:sulfite exporter TauE/SafE family protein [Geminicoccaceae bacterium]